MLLKDPLGLQCEDYQHVVVDKFLCMVAGCAFGTDVCLWIFFKKVSIVQGQ